MSTKHSVWQDLVTSMLAVYKCSLEKVDSYADAMDTEGLFEPNKLATYSPEEITKKLDRAGYQRGELNAIFTDRLKDTGERVKNTGKKDYEKVLTSKDKQAIEKILKPIKGVGPKVIENFFTLRGL